MVDKDRAWAKASKARGKDPAKYRRDDLGNEIFYGSYGKDSEMGWQIDHIKPKSKGGSDNIRNLRALKTEANRLKGDSIRRPGLTQRRIQGI